MHAAAAPFSKAWQAGWIQCLSVNLTFSSALMLSFVFVLGCLGSLLECATLWSPAVTTPEQGNHPSVQVFIFKVILRFI